MAGREDRARGAEEQGWALATESCRIGLSRGRLTATFYARRPGDRPGDPSTEHSSPFRWLESSGAGSDEARLSHYELLARLKADGWTPTGQGDEWYATELTLPLLVRADEPAAVELRADPQPEPAGAVLSAFVPELAAPAAPRTPVTAARRWRFASATGLLAALALLGWVATHASAVGALRN